MSVVDCPLVVVCCSIATAHVEIVACCVLVRSVFEGMLVRVLCAVVDYCMVNVG